MASEQELSLVAIDLSDVMPIIEAMLHGPMGQADRPHAAAACLLSYFILSAPQTLSRDQVGKLLVEGTALLMPLLMHVLETMPPSRYGSSASKES